MKRQRAENLRVYIPSQFLNRFRGFVQNKTTVSCIALPQSWYLIKTSTLPHQKRPLGVIRICGITGKAIKDSVINGS